MNIYEVNKVIDYVFDELRDYKGIRHEIDRLEEEALDEIYDNINNKIYLEQQIQMTKIDKGLYTIDQEQLK